MAHLPDLKIVSELFNMLVGKSAPIKESAPLKLTGSRSAPLFVGLYSADGSENVSAAFVVDLAVAAGSAGALSGMPAGVIMENVKQKQLNELLTTNFHEVANIAGSLLNRAGSAHLRLTEAIVVDAAPEGSFRELLDGQLERLDMAITIPPCPAGRVTLLRAAA